MPLSRVRGASVPLGFITPSGNVVVERVAAAVLADFPKVSAHFSRIEVVGSTDAYADAYDWNGMREAARLLSHMKPAALCWNGSKGGSIGFGFYRHLRDRIEEWTGIPATTSTLAIDAVLQHTGAKRLALVTPYTATYGGKIPEHFARAGYEVVSEAHAGVSDNLSYAAIPDADILAMARDAATARPDVLLTYCTNFPAAHLVARMETELGLPVYDSVTAGIWGALCLAKQPTKPGQRWGSLFGLDIRL